jgi:branched-chain amino acid transport system permease protein
MSDFAAAYAGLIDFVALNALLAYSQGVVLRAGVFSLATAGFAAIGAYASVLSVTELGLPAPLGILAGALLSTVVAGLLALPLARLRGVFQAIATLAFVQIVLSFNQNAASITQGALGINGIPKYATTPVLLVTLAAVMFVLWNLSRSRIGRAMDAIRQDETVAVSLGVSVFRTHALVFLLSGFLGGLGGALEAFHSYSITPGQFGFHLLVASLTYVVLGGRTTLLGPLVGALILTLLPEVARAFKDYSLLFHGALLVAVIIYLPHGIVDTLTLLWHRRRLAQGSGLERLREERA